MGDSSAASAKPHCSSDAATLNPNHATRYPAANANMRRAGERTFGSFRTARWKMRIVGSALGSIIATIIAAHIEKMRRRYGASQFASIIQTAAPSMRPYISSDVGTRYAHAQAITPARPTITRALSLKDSRMPCSPVSGLQFQPPRVDNVAHRSGCLYRKEGLSWTTF